MTSAVLEQSERSRFVLKELHYAVRYADSIRVMHQRMSDNMAALDGQD